jgi:hypothetical protein
MADSWGEKLTASISVLTLGLGIVAAVLGVPNWWLIFVVGWLVLTPLSAILFDVDDEAEGTLEPPSPPRPSEWSEADADQSATGGSESTQDALETLRDRYARGELSEEQFERKLEKLLQTETVEDARDRMADAAERSREREGERDADREREPER